MSQIEIDRHRDLDRFLTFVDAIAAIAITLLVLPLADLAAEVGDGPVGEHLRAHVDELVAFCLSFGIIAQLWFAQHRVVSSLVVPDPVVVRLLVAWTFTVVVLPFPTALVAEAAAQSGTKAFYVGTMAVSSALLALVALRIRRRPELRDRDPGPDPLPGWTAVAGFTLALVVMLAVPASDYWPLFLLFLKGPVERAVRAARGSGERTGPVGR